jgi:murein DD-endopeptidase MepM/ murein hydrolase activator NlpD
MLAAILMLSANPGGTRPAGAAAPASSVLARVPSYRAPVPAPVIVLHPFHAPATVYGAGHRGVDLQLAAGRPVMSAGAGQVRFAGRGVVVIAHATGVTTEYEPVTPAVQVGDVVVAGQRIGTLAGTSCPAGACLHWGAKRAGRYFDPLSLLHPLGPVRLLPDRP